MSNPSRPPRPSRPRVRSEKPRLSIGVYIETTDERPPDWESTWAELLLKPLTSSGDTPHIVPIPAPAPEPPPPPVPPAAPPSAPAHKEGGDVA